MSELIVSESYCLQDFFLSSSVALQSSDEVCGTLGVNPRVIVSKLNS